MNEEILNGVEMGPDHEKKDGTSKLIGCAILLALMTAVCVVAGTVGFWVAWTVS